jgi:serine/threonine protein kinase
MLKESLERLCGAVAEADGWELNQHLGDTSTLRAHMMTREQWEIERAALEIHEHGCLGRGSFGEVHRGTWRGCEVAVKRLREDMANDRELLEFRRELAIVNHLAHPNIVQFLGACTNSMPLCIVTEFMPGGNLADLLTARAEDAPYPVGRCLNWALDTAKGMRYLHERRPTMIIHRDLKPENLLLDASGRVKITDFGLSKSAMQLRGERSVTSEQQTVSRTTCGTWLYTAPEVYKKEPYTAKVDQFAFAMILFELLQGAPPFRAMPAEEATVQLALGHRPQFKREVNAELAALVERCWHQDPAARPSFAEIQRSLEAVLAQLQPADFEERTTSRSLLPRASREARGGAGAPAGGTQPQCGCTVS